MELQDYLADCTVLVETDVAVGTGFFIAPGLLITPAHVVESRNGSDYPLLGDVTIRNGQETYRATTIRYAAGPNPDLAILRVEASDHPSAFLYGPVRPDDPLFVCGFGSDTRESERLVFEGCRMRGSLLELEPGNARKILAGAPVLNLRTGGVCAIVTSEDALDSPQISATAVSVVDSLFPEIRDVHDSHHEADPHWFDSRGFVGTAFAARAHLIAMRKACQEPIQPLLSPQNGSGAVDLMAPVQFKVLTDDGVDRMPLDLEDLATRCGSDGRGIMVVGPSGSGRSSMLRYLGYSAAHSSGNLGARGDHCLFPILIRANQVASRTGEIEEQILGAIQKTSGPVGTTRLPSTFLSDLVETSGLRLLIMIDGVDEIQNSRDMVEVVDFIGRIQKEPSFGKKARLVVTSKPSTAEHFRYSDVDVYQIQPLDPNSIEVAARRWFSDRADQFIKDNQPLVQTGLLSSPLALSLALALYERNAEPLPARLVKLYGELVRDTARNWSNPALRDKYGDEIIDNAVDVLGFLALELLRSATVQDRPWILHSVTSYFIQHLKVDPARAGDIAARFVDFAAEDSLFLRTAGDRLFWSHSSFQDYFAAHRLVTASDEAGNAVKAIRSRWFDANRGNAPAFATAMLASEEERMQIVWEIMSSGREERLDFVTSLIIDGAELPDDILEQLVETLVSKSDQEKADYGTMFRPSARRSFAFDLLFSLRHIPQAGAALRAIASGSEWPSHMRGKASLGTKSAVS
jgi:hypothetical protein